MNNAIDISKIITINSIHPKNLKTEHWLEDFENLFQMIKDNYPYLWVKERTHGYNWLDLKEKYLSRIKNAREINEFLDIFWDAIIALQNRHTDIQMLKKIAWSFQEESSRQRIEPHKSIFTN